MTNWRSLSKLTLTLFLGPGFTSTSSVSVIKQLHSHKSMPRRILNNRKIEIYDFVLMFFNITLSKQKCDEKDKKQK